MTIEEKVALLEQDWLERDGETYVRIRTTDRLGWEDTLPEDSAYSSVILNPATPRDLYKNALSIARNMVISMGHPYKVTVKVDAERNATDSHTLWVATKVFDDESLPLGKRLDVFIGAAVHEGSHLMYTDFTIGQNDKSRLLHAIHNVIEDEMIERHTGEENPGLANFLKATKYFYFGKVQDDMPQNQNDLTKAFNAWLKLVRYPAALTQEEVHNFADLLLETREILTPYPENTEETYETAKKIYELLKQYAEDNMDEDDEGQGQGQSEGEEGDEEGNGQGSSKQAGSGNGKGRKLSDEELEEILEKILDAIEKNIKESNTTITENDMAKDLKENDHLLAKEMDGQLEIGKNAVILKKDPDKARYMSDLRAVKKYIPAVQKALITHGAEITSVQTGLKRGMLDGNKIAEAVQGNKNVYCRKEVTRPDRVNLSKAGQ